MHNSCDSKVLRYWNSIRITHKTFKLNTCYRHKIKLTNNKTFYSHDAKTKLILSLSGGYNQQRCNYKNYCSELVIFNLSVINAKHAIHKSWINAAYQIQYKDIDKRNKHNITRPAQISIL